MEHALKASILKEYGITAVGGFVLVILQKADQDPIPGVQNELEGYAAAGALTLVLAADSGAVGYDEIPPILIDLEWDSLFNNLNRIQAEAAKMRVYVVRIFTRNNG